MQLSRQTLYIPALIYSTCTNLIKYYMCVFCAYATEIRKNLYAFVPEGV